MPSGRVKGDGEIGEMQPQDEGWSQCDPGGTAHGGPAHRSQPTGDQPTGDQLTEASPQKISP